MMPTWQTLPFGLMTTLHLIKHPNLQRHPHSCKWIAAYHLSQATPGCNQCKAGAPDNQSAAANASSTHGVHPQQHPNNHCPVTNNIDSMQHVEPRAPRTALTWMASTDEMRSETGGEQPQALMGCTAAVSKEGWSQLAIAVKPHKILAQRSTCTCCSSSTPLLSPYDD